MAEQESPETQEKKGGKGKKIAICRHRRGRRSPHVVARRGGKEEEGE